MESRRAPRRRGTGVHDRMTARAERAGLAERRRRLLGRAVGRVLEIGDGSGRNLPFYGAASEVTVLVPDEDAAARLRPDLVTCPVPARVVVGGLDAPGPALGPSPGPGPSPEAGFDTVVCTLVLCSLPDLPAAAARIRELLAPGGHLLFLEHVRAPGGRGAVQAALGPLWSRAVPGCHLDRDPVTAVRRAGLLVADYERVHLPLGPLASTGVEGVACEHLAPPLAEPGVYPLIRPRFSGRLRPRRRSR